jgi:AraC family transcriptional regulator
MDWVTGMARAIDFIENNLDERLDFDEIAKQAYSSSYHFMRVFSILCGYTLGEYIRNRRLTLAGNELANTNEKVIDIAMKYGYDSPDSFARAFNRFHGVSPSVARLGGVALRSFSRIHLKLTLEGGSDLIYRLEEKDACIFTGYARYFDGIPGNRGFQEREFFTKTREKQNRLKELSEAAAEHYTIITNINDEGYDYYIASLLPTHMREQAGNGFEQITIPKTTYAIFETEKDAFRPNMHLELRKKIISEWLPSSGYLLAEAPEIAYVRWHEGEQREVRSIELWIPITKG